MSGHYLKLFVPANSPTRGHRCRTSGWGELQAVTVGRGEQISYPELSTRRRSSGFESRFMRQSLSAHSIPGSSPQPTTKTTGQTHSDVYAQLGEQLVRVAVSRVMILPQVHLRKPCYDFYFLQAIEFERLLGHRCRLFPTRPRPIRGPH